MTNPAIPTDAQAEPFVSYEYAQVSAPKNLEPLYTDAYRSFGWTVEATDGGGAQSVRIDLKRDREIRSRSVIQELQRKAEGALARITQLERSRKTVPTMVGIVLGLLGCVPLAISVFMITGGAAGLVSTGLGAIGLLLWVAGFLSYRAVKSGRASRIDAGIAREQDVIATAGQQAARLL